MKTSLSFVLRSFLKLNFHELILRELIAENRQKGNNFIVFLHVPSKNYIIVFCS